MENLSQIFENSGNVIFKFGSLVIETISVPGREGIRTAAVKTSFKNIISVSLTPYITYGQQANSSQSIHDADSYIITSKSLRFYCNGNQTVNICIIGLI